MEYLNIPHRSHNLYYQQLLQSLSFRIPPSTSCRAQTATPPIVQAHFVSAAQRSLFSFMTTAGRFLLHLNPTHLHPHPHLNPNLVPKLASYLDASLFPAAAHPVSSFPLPTFTSRPYIFGTLLNGHLTGLPISKLNLRIILPETPEGILSPRAQKLQSAPRSAEHGAPSTCTLKPPQCFSPYLTSVCPGHTSMNPRHASCPALPSAPAILQGSPRPVPRVICEAARLTQHPALTHGSALPALTKEALSPQGQGQV